MEKVVIDIVVVDRVELVLVDATLEVEIVVLIGVVVIRKILKAYTFVTLIVAKGLEEVVALILTVLVGAVAEVVLS